MTYMIAMLQHNFESDFSHRSVQERSPILHSSKSCNHVANYRKEKYVTRHDPGSLNISASRESKLFFSGFKISRFC